MKKPLRIGLISQGGGGWIGGTQYIRNIISALGSLPAEVRSTFEICLLYDQPDHLKLYESVEPYLDYIYDLSVQLEPATLQNRILWKLIKMSLKQHNPRFINFVEKAKINFLYPITYADIENHSSLPSCKWVGWIPDFQHKFLPQFFSEAEITIREQGISSLVDTAPTIVLSSKSAQSDLEKFFPNASSKSAVLTFKTIVYSDLYKVDSVEIQKKYYLPDKFFIVSNQFFVHKNHTVILEALALLKKQFISPNVVFTGHFYDSRKPNHFDTILQMTHKLGIAGQVYFLGLIPKEDQIQLIRRSIGLIQPSLFEGWSTVVEDGRALGKPILLSDLPVHLEQNPPNSLFFKPDSPEDLAAHIASFWEKLSPGPNLENEAVARQNNVSEVQSFGYSFLDIVQRACSEN